MKWSLNVKENSVKIYVDADACPVKETIIKVAHQEEIPVILVQSFSHFSHEKQSTAVEKIYVDSGADAADFKIMELAKKGDIIVTQDYGLASLGLAKGCLVVHHKGFTYTDNNIDHLLQTRYLSAMARKSGQRTKGPRAFSNEDKTKFKELLQKTIRENK